MRPVRSLQSLRSSRRFVGFKQAGAPQYSIEALFDFRRGRYHGEPVLVGGEYPETLHHVLDRNWICIEKNRLIDFEQALVQSSGCRQVVLPDGLTHLA